MHDESIQVLLQDLCETFQVYNIDYTPCTGNYHTEVLPIPLCNIYCISISIGLFSKFPYRKIGSIVKHLASEAHYKHSTFSSSATAVPLGMVTSSSLGFNNRSGMLHASGNTRARATITALRP